MKTFRNMAFLLLVATAVLVRQGALSAYYPPPEVANCPDGCTCQVDEFNPHYFEGYCADVGATIGCSYGLSTCSNFCNSTLPNWWLEHTQQWVSCWVGDYECAESLEPPTEWTCNCICW